MKGFETVAQSSITMEHGMVRPGRYWVLGGAVSEGGPGVINVYNREQIKKVNLEGLPMCRMHDPSMVAGKWMTSLANEGIRYVMGHIDAQDPMTMGVVHELLSGQLKDLSLTDYAVAIKGGKKKKVFFSKTLNEKKRLIWIPQMKKIVKRVYLNFLWRYPSSKKGTDPTATY